LGGLGAAAKRAAKSGLIYAENCENVDFLRKSGEKTRLEKWLIINNIDWVCDDSIGFMRGLKS
jgi:hypothetical protein